VNSERTLNLQGHALRIFPANLYRLAAVVLLGLLSAAAIVIVARRLAGALETPLEPAPLFSAGVLAAMALAAIRIGWLFSPTAAGASRLDWVVMAAASLAAIALAAALCLPETSLPGLFLLWIPLATEELWAWTKRGQNYFSPKKMPTPAEINSSDPFLLQRLTRSRAADGAEELSGWLRMAFAAGQRTGSLHVAFCPPFDAAPDLEIEQIEGPESRLKTAQLLPYGARIDLKLLSPAEEATSVLVQFSARTARAKE
jgi:hypothetical protein